MTRNQAISVSDHIIFLLLLTNVIALKNAFVIHKIWYCVLVITIPMFIVSLIMCRRKRNMRKR
jgi:hypothetical protein